MNMQGMLADGDKATWRSSGIILTRDPGEVNDWLKHIPGETPYEIIDNADRWVQRVEPILRNNHLL